MSKFRVEWRPNLVAWVPPPPHSAERTTCFNQMSWRAGVSHVTWLVVRSGGEGGEGINCICSYQFYRAVIVRRTPAIGAGWLLNLFEGFVCVRGQW